MRKKLVWLVFLGSTIVATAGSALATPPQEFTSTTTAQGQFASFDVSNYFISDKGKLWFSSQKTKVKSDGYFLTNVWQPGGTTGWHTHLGHTLIIVTAGTITHYDGDDPSCTPHVYTTGMTFVDRGGSHVHIVRNEGMSRHKSLRRIAFVRSGSGTGMAELYTSFPARLGGFFKQIQHFNTQQSVMNFEA